MPRWLCNGLKHLLPYEFREAVLGDMEEMYRVNRIDRSKTYAAVWLIGATAKTLPAVVTALILWSFDMLRNFILMTWRQMKRQKIYAAINILGLAVGLACALSIFNWVAQERSYDQYHSRHHQLFRVLTHWKNGDHPSASTPGLLAGSAVDEIPQVVRATRFLRGSRAVYRTGDKAFYEDGAVSLDASALEIFDFEFISGDAASALADKKALVLTESTAHKYFGDADALGEELVWNNWQTYYVAAVIKDQPVNSHLQFDLIDSHEMGEEAWAGGYSWNNFIHTTYLELNPDADSRHVEEQLGILFARYSPEIAPHVQGFTLQPVTDIHLNASVQGGGAKVMPVKYVTIFSFVALLILIIACVNFMNLATARAEIRAREVGLRKVVGSGRGLLMLQFLGEAVFYTALAMAFAVVIFIRMQPQIASVMGDELMPLSITAERTLWLAGMLLFTAFLAGSYPAVFLSSFRPAVMLKQKGQSFGHGRSFRKGLVISQFVVSIFLIIMTLGISSQLKFMQQAAPGYNRENLIVLPLKEGIRKNYAAVKEALLSSAAVTAVASRDCLPLMAVQSTSVKSSDNVDAQEIPVQIAKIDYGYFKTMGMEMLIGREFDESFGGDFDGAYIINESALRALQMTDPLGKSIDFQNLRMGGRIVGVVKDANFNSLRQSATARIYTLLHEYDNPVVDLMGVMMLRLNAADNAFPANEALDHVRSVWQRFNPNYPFEYYHMDDVVAQLYFDERVMARLMTYFTILAMIISGLGLTGLASFNARHRTREMAVRKVLGASLGRLLRLMTGETLRQLFYANLLAWPLSAWMLHRWLNGFAMRIDFPYALFPLALTVTLVLALAASGGQVILAVRQQPVKSLRMD